MKSIIFTSQGSNPFPSSPPWWNKLGIKTLSYIATDINPILYVGSGVTTYSLVYVKGAQVVHMTK